MGIIIVFEEGAREDGGVRSCNTLQGETSFLHWSVFSSQKIDEISYRFPSPHRCTQVEVGIEGQSSSMSQILLLRYWKEILLTEANSDGKLKKPASNKAMSSLKK